LPTTRIFIRARSSHILPASCLGSPPSRRSST
jgi:hypothetical protein